MSEFNVSPEVKSQLIADRLNQLNVEGYQHELLLKQFEAVDALESEEAQTSKNAIVAIKAAIAVCEAEVN
jgi:hypothetical protein